MRFDGGGVIDNVNVADWLGLSYAQECVIKHNAETALVARLLNDMNNWLQVQRMSSLCTPWRQDPLHGEALL